jgi:EAL domain-containing protein (putative c-di-GMP-specific phosphodiesterase class I)
MGPILSRAAGAARRWRLSPAVGAARSDAPSTVSRWLPWIALRPRVRAMGLDLGRCAAVLLGFALASAGAAVGWQLELVKRSADANLQTVLAEAERRSDAIRLELESVAGQVNGPESVGACPAELQAALSRLARRSLLIRDIAIAHPDRAALRTVYCTPEGPILGDTPGLRPVDRLVLLAPISAGDPARISLQFGDGLTAVAELDPRTIEIRPRPQTEAQRHAAGVVSLLTPEGQVLTSSHEVSLPGPADEWFVAERASTRHAFKLRWVLPRDAWRAARDERLAQTVPIGLGLGGLLISALWLRTLQRARTTYRLERGLRKRQFVPFLQPIVCLSDGRCIGAEVLMRWDHPQRGIVAPGEFIEVAERSGLITPMSELVFTRTAARLAGLAQANPGLYFSFNLTPGQLRTPGFDAWLARCFRADTIARHQVLLEITERDAVEDGSREALWNLHQQGWRLAVDDFGTGHSSLAMLQTLPVDTLKIDRAFVRTIGQDTTQSPVLDSIVQMAGRLKMKLIAEGIETLEQWNYLAGSRVHAAQGYLMAKPMAVGEFIAWFERQAGTPQQQVPAPREARHEEAQLQALWERMVAPAGLDIRDRSHRFKRYPQCFVASEAVSWISRELGIGREEAVRLGERLEALGWIRHVVDEHGFKDAELFFVARRMPAATALTAASASASAPALAVPIAELRTAVRNPVGGPRARTVSRGLVQHRDVLSGREIVSWIVERWHLPRDAATRAGTQLMASGALRHVFDDHPFEDSRELYRLG